MTSDLDELNRRIAKRIGLAEDLIGTCTGYLSICVGRLNTDVGALKRLAESQTGTVNALDVIYINRDYLNYARIVAQNVVRGANFSGLLVLGMNMQQARVIADLSNAQITRIAKYATGEIFVALGFVSNFLHFQSSVRPQFAAALIAA